MTFKEKLLQDHPDKVRTSSISSGCSGCPSNYGYEPERDEFWCDEISCSACWNRQMYGAEEKPHILDSGERRQFKTGAVRDIQEGKGRCDLMPLRVAAKVIDGDSILDDIGLFLNTGDTQHLYFALRTAARMFNGLADMLLEVAKHFEEGAKKYGENNWQKGLPVHCYIDSAVRHYLKWLRGDKDEPHDRAFVWNLVCCIWEVDFSPRAKGTTAKAPEEKCSEKTNAIAKNTQITLRDCPVGLFEYLKTGARYADRSYCAIPVDTGVGVAIYSENMVTRIRLKDYGLREQQTAIGDIETGLFMFDDELWVSTDHIDNESFRHVYNLHTGKCCRFHISALVNRVDALTYEEVAHD